MYTFKFHIFYLNPLPYSDNGFQDFQTSLKKQEKDFQT